MKTLIIGTVAGTPAAAAVAVADPGTPDIGTHRHYVKAANGSLVQVGPRLCDDAQLQQAFNEFHSNVHHAVPGSPGPEVSAPGLHNARGAEILAGGS